MCTRNSKSLALFFVIFYIIMAYFTFMMKDMIAMYMMATGMLLESIISFIYSLTNKH
ncbi:hypothetical protein [Periweissella cryptocerci]|uniref:hypothetical protein n=1 Tax=Periweissella cryptocerci TaxID=2506420 RepID=UPI00140490C1|nr:hypothetical protein [Periweissella cryptocerci]